MTDYQKYQYVGLCKDCKHKYKCKESKEMMYVIYCRNYIELKKEQPEIVRRKDCK